MGITRHKNVGIMQARRLVSVVSGTDKESVRELCDRIDEKVDSYANGDLDHAVNAVTLLWKLSKGDKRSPPLSPVATNSVSQPSLTAHPPAHRQGQHPPYPAKWTRRSIRMAFIKSIREGIFFDRKYWTRNSKTSRALRPLHISSIVASEYLSHIDDCE